MPIFTIALDPEGVFSGSPVEYGLRLTGQRPQAPPVAPYAGPGDVVSGFLVWGGLWAYGAATAGTKAIRVRRASDNAESDISTLSTGPLDTASALTFAGIDATGNATSAGTSVALTGLSGAAHVGDAIVGAGFVGTVCVSVGSLVAGAQTVTTNTSQSIGVSEAVTLYWGLYLTTLYDQPGSGASNFTQSFASLQPQLSFNAQGSGSTLPGILFAGAQRMAATLSGGDITVPYSMSVVAVSLGTNGGAMLVSYNNTDGGSFLFPTGSANLVQAINSGGGPYPTTAATSGVLHAFQTMFNGSNATFNVDGTVTGPTSVGTAGNFHAFCGIGQAPGAFLSGSLVGSMGEVGLKAALFSAADQAALRANQQTRWNTP